MNSSTFQCHPGLKYCEHVAKMLQNCETENSAEKMRNEKNGLATKFIHAQMKTISRLSQARRNVGISLTLDRVKRTLESKPTRDQVKFSQLSDISTFHCLCNERRSGAGAWKRGSHVRNNGPVRFPSLLRNFSRRSWTLFIYCCMQNATYLRHLEQISRVLFAIKTNFFGLCWMFISLLRLFRSEIFPHVIIAHVNVHALFD